MLLLCYLVWPPKVRALQSGYVRIESIDVNNNTSASKASMFLRKSCVVGKRRRKSSLKTNVNRRSFRRRISNIHSWFYWVGADEELDQILGGSFASPLHPQFFFDLSPFLFRLQSAEGNPHPDVRHVFENSGQGLVRQRSQKRVPSRRGHLSRPPGKGRDDMLGLRVQTPSECRCHFLQPKPRCSQK